MKIIDESLVEFATVTGRSGVNLDEKGYTINNTKITAWVIDGVSPIIFSKKQKKKFWSFLRAGRYLNSIFRSHEWKNLDHSFRDIAKSISNSEIVTSFISGPFFLWPLFSIGIVQINFIKGIIQFGLYGDCMIIIDRGGKYSIIEYAALEQLKEKLDVLFSISNKILPNQLSTYFRKIIFSIIRFQQIYFGKVRIFSIRKDFGPAIKKTCKIDGVKKIHIMSDGVTWYFKDNKEKIAALISIIDQKGPKEALNEIRRNEIKNLGFGYFDDATILTINISEFANETP